MQVSTLFKEIVNELKISDAKLFSQNIHLPKVQDIDNLLKNELFINLFKEYKNKLVISKDPLQIKNQLKTFFYKIVGNQTQSGGDDFRSFAHKKAIRKYAENLEREIPGISIIVIALILISMLLKSVYESNSNPGEPIAQQIFDMLYSVLGQNASNTGGKKLSKKHRKSKKLSKKHGKSKKRSKKHGYRNRRKTIRKRY